MPNGSSLRGAIPSNVLESFRSALELSNDKLQGIGKWLSAHRDFVGDREIEPSLFERAAAELSITPAEFAGALSLVMTLLVSQRRPREIDHEYLKRLGLGAQSDKVDVLLGAVDIPASEVEYTRQKGLALQSAIPTLDDVDILCDLRAVFRRLPSASQSDQHLENVKLLLGFEPVVIVSLELNDSTGKDTPCLFQVSEAGMRHLIKTLQESLVQLEIVSDVQKSLAFPRKMP